jgi:hypothetical protein
LFKELFIKNNGYLGLPGLPEKLLKEKENIKRSKDALV